MSTARSAATVCSRPTVPGARFPWYALRVKSRFEKVSAAALDGRGYEQFLPLYRPLNRRSVIELPLFPGYLFCRFNAHQRLPVLTSPGILHIVGIGREPEPVEEREIAAVRSVIESGITAEPWPFLEVGQRVRVNAGPLAGIEGTLVRFKNRDRFVVSVTLLQRSVAVEVGPELSVQRN